MYTSIKFCVWIWSSWIHPTLMVCCIACSKFVEFAVLDVPSSPLENEVLILSRWAPWDDGNRYRCGKRPQSMIKWSVFVCFYFYLRLRDGGWAMVRYNRYRCGVCRQFVCCLFPFLFYVFVMVIELWYDISLRRLPTDSFQFSLLTVAHFFPCFRLPINYS